METLSDVRGDINVPSVDFLRPAGDGVAGDGDELAVPAAAAVCAAAAAAAAVATAAAAAAAVATAAAAAVPNTIRPGSLSGKQTLKLFVVVSTLSARCTAVSHVSCMFVLLGSALLTFRICTKYRLIDRLIDFARGSVLRRTQSSALFCPPIVSACGLPRKRCEQTLLSLSFPSSVALAVYFRHCFASVRRIECMIKRWLMIVGVCVHEPPEGRGCPHRCPVGSAFATHIRQRVIEPPPPPSPPPSASGSGTDTRFWCRRSWCELLRCSNTTSPGSLCNSNSSRTTLNSSTSTSKRDRSAMQRLQ